MKIGIYGGSFNPVHFGHLGLAEWTVEHTDLDEIWMLVSPNNPLKDPAILADEQSRLQALQAAINKSKIKNLKSQIKNLKSQIKNLKSKIIASDFEFHLPRPTYTANTLRELVKTYPEHTFTLIIGEDNWDIFDQWREHDYILSHFRVFIYPRHKVNYPQSTINNQQSTINNLNVHYLKDAPYFDISSTAIRAQQA